MLNLSTRRKQKHLTREKQVKEKKLIEKTYKKPEIEIQNKQEIELKRLTCLHEKDKFENSNMGDFQNLYPLPRGVSKEQDDLMDLYDYIYMRKSREVYLEHCNLGALSKQKAKDDFEALEQLIQTIFNIQYGQVTNLNVFDRNFRKSQLQKSMEKKRGKLSETKKEQVDCELFKFKISGKHIAEHIY